MSKKKVDSKVAVLPAPAAIITDLLTVVDMLMPGIGGIAVPDYALLNEALIRARQWLAAQPKDV